MNVFWIKYGTQSTIEFPMVKRGVVDFAVSADWTPAAADSAISKDGGNYADTTNSVAIAGGTPTRSVVGWRLVISSTEAQCAEANIQIVDAATKAVEDQFLKVYTYGNASAKFAGDWSDLVRLGLTGLANATPGAAGGLLIAGTNAATTFNGAAASGATPATSGLTVTGGAASTTGGGVAAPAITATGGAGAASTNGAAEGVKFAGGGTNTVASSAHGLNAVGTSNGDGIAGTGGSGASGDGISGTAGGGVDVRGNITGNVTGNLSGSAGSVTATVNSDVKKINGVTIVGDGSGTPFNV